VSEDWTAVAVAINERLSGLGWRQRDLAERSGVSLATVREIQRHSVGRRRSPRTLQSLSSDRLAGRASDRRIDRAGPAGARRPRTGQRTVPFGQSGAEAGRCLLVSGILTADDKAFTYIYLLSSILGLATVIAISVKRLSWEPALAVANVDPSVGEASEQNCWYSRASSPDVLPRSGRC
jgi:hypothetical protein